MSRFIAFIVLTFCVLCINAQISYTKPERIPYEFVYGAKLTHYFANDKYEYTVFSDNDEESEKITLLLGTGVDESISSLNNLMRMWEEGRPSEERVGVYKVNINNDIYEISSIGFWCTRPNCIGVYFIKVSDIQECINILNRKRKNGNRKDFTD